jgi:dTDP-4-dehydrorhamnose 3,5-epimerase
MDSMLIPHLTDLSIIPGGLGEVRHILKMSDIDFSNFGEAYFSSVSQFAVKGWKRHNQMISNLVVPVGKVQFVVYDNRPGSPIFQKPVEFFLSGENYKRLTIPPGIWFAFKGINEGLNLILNISSIEHDPLECDHLPIQDQLIPFSFE